MLQYWALIKRAFNDWLEDRAMRLAASLAFYTMLSLAPLLVLAVKAVGSFFSEDAAREQVHHYLSEVMGNTAGDAVTKMIGPLSQPGSGLFATSLSVIILLVSASAVFGELQDSLNTIWEVKPKPGRGIIGIIQERFLSFVLVIGVCFLLLVSLIVTTALTGLTHYLGGSHPTFGWHIFNFVISMSVVTTLFAMIFKYLPDVEIRWREVWPGAIATGVLFTVGKFLLSWYLARGSTTSVYAAAGSLISVLLWVYYSSQILFFGAEITQAYALQTRKVKPTENAVKVTEEDRAQQGMPSEEHVEKASAEKPANKEKSGAIA